MKLTNVDDRIHVLDAEVTAYDTLVNICESGVQEDSFFVCEVDEIIRKFKEWSLLMPRIHPHYAVKCNDHPTVLEILAALGTGFDCASKSEMNKVLDMGVEPEQIIYAHPTKIASHVRHAAAMGVRLMTFDNEVELHKSRSLHPNAKLVIRIRCDDETAQCNLGVKYGCDAYKEAPDLLAVAASLGLDVVGVSFHVGSGCRNPPVFRKAITLARHVFDVATALGFSMTLLDIGGGFSGNIADIANVVNPTLDQLFPDPEVHVIAEPGRYFVDSAFTLAVSIHSKREIRSGDDVTHVMYYINDGIYGSFSGILFENRAVRGVPINSPRGKLVPSTIWGPTCDGLDKVETDSLLPMMELGTWLAYREMGAYSLATATAFNGFPIPRAHVVASETAWRFLKERLPLSDEHFVFGSLPANLQMGLDIGGKMPLVEVARRLSVVSQPAELHRSTSMGSLSSDGSSSMDMGLEAFPADLCRSHDSAGLADASPLIFDFVQVGPLNER